MSAYFVTAIGTDIGMTYASAQLLRAAYDPVLPVAAQDPSFALRLAARMEAPQ